MSFHKNLHSGNTSILKTLEHIEEGRSDIYKWSERRISKRKGIHGKIFFIKKLFINRSVLRNFVRNLTLIVALQMLLAGLFTYMCSRFDLDFDVNMALFVSPVIFPLAFSINADFQRRERVLEDLALFKGALVILFFCHRDWLTSSELPQDFLTTVNNKLRGLVLNIKEYLLTENLMRRQFILSVIYEDFSDISQLNDKMRGSRLPHNSPLITRLVHYHNHMCLAFERLRVVREYRSPRTIRSFTKVFIFLMPIVLSPYYVHVGKKSGNFWSPYYVAVLTSFIFGTLQGVQDVLDDPFDGLSEDDINLGQLEDWTTQSLLTNRTVHVGRFTVTTAVKSNVEDDVILPLELQYDSDPTKVVVQHKRYILRRSSGRKFAESTRDRLDTVETEARYPGVVSRVENMEKRGLTGSTTILPGFHLKQQTVNGDSPDGSSEKSLVDTQQRDNGTSSAVGHKMVSFDDDSSFEEVEWTLSDENIDVLPTAPENIQKVLLGNSSGTSLVSPRAQGKRTEAEVLPRLAQLFEPLQSSSADDQVNGGACPPKVPQSLSSLFGNNDPGSTEVPPVATITTDKPRFTVGPAGKSVKQSSPSSCPVPIPKSRFRRHSPITPVQSDEEQEPLMSTARPSYGMTSCSPDLTSSNDTSRHPHNSISRPSRFSLAKSPQTHDTTPQSPDQVKTDDKADSIEMEVRNTSQENRCVEDALNLSYDDSEVDL